MPEFVTIFDRPPLESGAPAPGTKGTQTTVTLTATASPGVYVLTGANPGVGCRVTWHSEPFEVVSAGLIKRV